MLKTMQLIQLRTAVYCCPLLPAAVLQFEDALVFHYGVMLRTMQFPGQQPLPQVIKLREGVDPLEQLQDHTQVGLLQDGGS